VLGLDELRRRRDAAARAAAGGATEPWMAWIGAYHALMRATLHVKARLAKAAPRAREPAAALAREASRMCGIALDAEYVRAVARPPQGRLGIVVMQRLSALFREPPETIARALFPVRRPSPYAYAPDG